MDFGIKKSNGLCAALLGLTLLVGNLLHAEPEEDLDALRGGTHNPAQHAPMGPPPTGPGGMPQQPPPFLPQPQPNQLPPQTQAVRPPEAPRYEAPPSDPRADARWVEILANRDITLHRGDQTLSFVNYLRALVSANSDDGLFTTVAHWVSSLNEEQRGRLRTLIEARAMEDSPKDRKIRQAFLDVLAGEACTTELCQRARRASQVHSEQWNKTLSEAVPDKNSIDLNKAITVHEKNGEKKTVRQWMEEQVATRGYDWMVRWATAYGGDTGEKTLALLAQLDSSTGATTPSIGIQPDPTKGVEIHHGQQKISQRAPSVLELKGEGNSKSPREMLLSVFPKHAESWNHVMFVRPQEVRVAQTQPMQPPALAQPPTTQHAQRDPNGMPPAGPVGPGAQVPPGMLPPPFQPSGPMIQGQGPGIQQPGLHLPPGTPPDEAQRIARFHQARQTADRSNPAVQKYEQGKRYVDGSPRERYHHPVGAPMFPDVPEGGTGKLIVACFSNNPQCAQMRDSLQNHPYVEVRVYPTSGSEYRHASLFGCQALGIDGLGRKLTRYPQSPSSAVQSIMSEIPELRQYLQAIGADPNPRSAT